MDVRLTLEFVRVFGRIAANVQGLPQAVDVSLSLRLSRTTNIFLFNGEANTMKACGKPYVSRRY